MLSLARHVSNPGQVAIHVVASDLVMPFMDEALRCFREELQGELPVLPTVSVVPERPCNLSDGTTVTPLVENCSQRFVRYCLQEFVPAAPRVLWVDTDIVFKDDVRKLYNMRMRYPVAATLYDPYVSVRAAGDEKGGLRWLVAHSYHLDPYMDYEPFNAGIMVYDLTKWRSGRITDALFRWLSKAGKLCTNQLVLNVFFRNGFDLFDWRWNVMVPRRVGLPSRCLEEAHAVHWAGVLKPWTPWGWWMHWEVMSPHWPERCFQQAGNALRAAE
eukprot:CAMPEP_0171160456 /NCGR_PEP_ID=MMETSP0790-20130122/3564_1 /TAXON_ID=2925 /ORGANISM="Alexandrium catenella, Strain OF101" /LENGTH=271 /DNA_ID=CAMNT_0011624985 /DNA_START=27 /DNA_END=840 /DNA_ORIENTATION=+